MLVALVATLTPTVPAFAANAADLDTSFGDGGRVNLGVGPSAVQEAANDVLVRPDGRIVVVGRQASTFMAAAFPPQILVAQLMPDGTPDPDFGPEVAGRSWLDVGGSLDVSGAALQSDGKILVVGTSTAPGADHSDMVVARFLTNGNPDPEFGEAGLRRINIAGNEEDGWSMDHGASIAETLTTSGEATRSILVAGTADYGTDDARFVVRRLDTADGSDTGPLATTGLTRPGTWASDIAVLSDGGFVVTGSGGHDGYTLTAKFDSYGVRDPEWGTHEVEDGIALTRTSLIGQSSGSGVVVDEGTGEIWVSGRWAATGMLLRYEPDGQLDASLAPEGPGKPPGVLLIEFGESGHTDDIFSVTLDADGRVLVVGQHTDADAQLGVARFDENGFDATFGSDGRRIYSCAPGLGSAIAVQPDGRIVAAGTCNNAITVLRLEGDAEPLGPVVADVAVGLSGSADAGSEVIDPEDVDPAALLTASGSESLQSAPVRNTPVRNTPVRNTPVRNTPVRNTPVRNTALNDPALPPVLLSEVRLFDGTWEERLVGTKYEAAPLQTVTLQDLLGITSPDPLAGMTLAHIAIEDTPVRNTSYASLLLSGVPLQDLPAPQGGWCDYLAGSPMPCGSTGADVTRTTLLALELNGVDLTAYLAQPLSLKATDLAGSTLGTFKLVDVNLPATPFASAPSTEVGNLLDCGSACPRTLGEAHDARQVRDDATLLELVRLLPRLTSPGDVSLGELIRGLFGPDELPFEDVPLPAILEAAKIRSDRLTRIAVEFDLDCRQTDGFVAEVETAQGVRYAGGGELSAEEVGVAVETVWQSLGGGRFGLEVADACEDAPDLVNRFTAAFDVEPFAALEVLSVRATVEAGEESESAEASSPLPIVDGTDRDGDGGSGPRGVTPGMLYTGYISGPGDIDDFTFPAPAAGSLVTVTASHLPADYDIVLYGPEEGIGTAPVRNTPVRNTPVRNTGLGDASKEAGSDANVLPPEGLQDIPVRNTPVRNTSLNRGTATESATTMVHDGDEGQPFTVQLSGYDGAWSNQPYVLQVRVTPGPEPLKCAARSFRGSGAVGTLHQAAGLSDEDVQTLILVNRERLGDVYGDDPTDLMAELEEFADRADVAGVVIPVEADQAVSSAYDAWDQDPCSVEAANDIVTAINTHVDAVRDGMTDLRHVVIVGNDEIIPMGRVPDRTTIGNQASYTRDVAYGGEDNAISRAFGRRFVLSDDPYADLDPVSWLAGGKLYVPDLALGRLVETPAEISAALAQFTDNKGVLDPQTAFTSGYEFLTDGAEAVEAALAKGVEQGKSTHRIDEIWDSSDALAGLLGDDKFSSVNAHYDHHRGLPALAFNQGGPDLFDTGGLSTATGPLSVDGSILFTMGCHSGLNVPDVYVVNPSAAEQESLNDWPQALTSRGGVYTGNTGYGYGDTEVVGYSETLMAYHAENLASGDMTAGQALMFAKQRHFGELGLPGVYDAKAMHESTFYGLPMYRIGPDGGLAPPVLPEEVQTSSDTEDSTFEVTPSAERIEGDRGDYWVVEEDGHRLPPQVSHFRPIQPRMSLEVTGTLPVHGVVIEELASSDVPGLVDPVYSEPTIDLGANQEERTPTEVVYPAGISRLAHYATPQGLRDDLVLVTGQFISNPATRDGTGTQRLFTRIAGTVHRSGSDDWQPPTVGTFEALSVGSAAQFVATTPDEDTARAVVLYRDDASTAWRKVELASDGSGRWTGGDQMSANGTRVKEAFLQLVDEAGNVGTITNKGEYEESTATPAPEDVDLVLDPALPASGYFAQVPSIAVSGADGVAYEYQLDGGDWKPVTGGTITLPSDLSDGTHTVTVRGSDGSGGTVWIPIDREGPVITITTPADGANFEVGSEVAAVFTCADAASGVASCTGTVAPGQPIDTSAGTHTFTVSAEDHLGHRTTRTVTYSAGIRFDGFDAPITGDGDQQVWNEVKAGSAVPIKFRLWQGSEQKTSTTGVSVIESAPFACGSTPGAETVSETTSGKGAGVLRYDAAEGQFVYIYASKKDWGTHRYCTTVTVTYGDSVVKTAYFKFKR